MKGLIDETENIFIFVFPIILFDTTGKADVVSKSAEMYKLKFMQQLEKYLLFQSGGNNGLAATRLGVANEMIHHFQDI